MRLFVWILLLSLLTPPAQRAEEHVWDTYVLDRMAATGVPGLAYAVVGSEGIERQGTFGKDGEGSPVDEHTPFLWGSVSKPVTATAALVLAQEGHLDLDTQVNAYLPGFAEGPTVRDLMTQTSGITGFAAFPVSDVYGPGSEDFGPRVAEVADSLTRPPGTYEYSSANYLVLGAVIEAASPAEDFRTHLREAVLDPAGMDGAFAGTAAARTAGLTPGHRFLWGVPVADAEGVDDAGVSYGYLGGDLTALAAFARLQLEDEPSVLDAPTLAAAREDAGQGYGLGWRQTEIAGEEAAFHGGATPGHATMLIVLPEHDRAVVIAQNAYELLRDGRLQAVGFGLAHLLVGSVPPAPGPATGHGVAVWGTTAFAAVTATGAMLSLRTGGRFRWVWAAFGILAVIAAGWLLLGFGARSALLWLPDVTVALLFAALAGLVPLVRVLWPGGGVRGKRVLRPGPGTHRPRRGSAR